MGSLPSRGVKQRSLHEWIFRGGIAVGALVLGCTSTAQTLAFAISKTNINQAFAISSKDGRIAGHFSVNLFINERSGISTSERSSGIARQALLDEPISISALTTLALNSELRGNVVLSRQLLTHSDELSRRDLRARLLLIEDAVARGDTAKALRNYDIALRASRGASGTLFPVLSAAIANPEVITPLSNLLSKRPPWGEDFLRYIIENNSDFSSLSYLFDNLDKKRTPIPDSIKANFVNSLATHGLTQDAWRFYSSMRGHIDRHRSRDQVFKALYSHPTVFDWMPITNDAGITASIQQTEQGGVFEFGAPSTVGGIVLEQMQRLPPGKYKLVGDASEIDVSADNLPYWALVCNDARKLGRIDFPVPRSGSVHFQGEFLVDSTCPAQLLRLVVQPSNAVGGVSGQINRVVLTPLGEAIQ